MLLVAASAEAKVAPLELTWGAPPQCPSGAEVQREVLHLLGASSGPLPHLVAQATVIEEAPNRWGLTLRTQLDGAAGERALVGQSCRSVADAAVITLALTLNPDLTLPEPEKNQPATREPTRPVPPPAPAPELIRPEEAARWFMGMLAGPRWGLFRSPLEEFGLSASYQRGRVLVALESSIGTATATSAKPARFADFTLVSARGVGCYALTAGVLGLFPCGGLDGTLVRGKSVGFDNSGQGFVAWNSLTFGAKVDIAFLARYRLELSGFGLSPLTRPSAYVGHNGDNEDMLRPKALGSRATIGLIGSSCERLFPKLLMRFAHSWPLMF